jgi:phenol/toluene 2-monooxygenase (NADH) P4/A4
MPVRAIGEYDFPSRSRQELYGDDQLIHVWWRNNMWFCAAACFRAPKAMTWGDFQAGLVRPLLEADPDFGPATRFEWSVDGAPVTPADDQTLAELGVGHKSLIACRSLD